MAREDVSLFAGPDCGAFADVSLTRMAALSEAVFDG
jgi:hypothetical protein